MWDYSTHDDELDLMHSCVLVSGDQLCHFLEDMTSTSYVSRPYVTHLKASPPFLLLTSIMHV